MNNIDGVNNGCKGNGLSRRAFLIELAKKSAGFIGLIAAGGIFVNRNRIGITGKVMSISSFRVIDEDIFVIAKGADARRATELAIESSGGIGRFVGKGDRVLIKVNCAFARPAWMGATSSPEVVETIIKLCYKAGASRVAVTDNPINDAELCFERSGLKQAIDAAGGQLILPRKNDFRDVKISDGIIGVWKTYYKPLSECDKLIGVPTLKTHNLCGASLAMKNWYGFIGGSRNRFHQDIHNVIAELGAFISPSLIVLDGTRALVRNGPTGGSSSDVVQTNTVAISTDQVAIDAFGLEMLGIDKTKIDYIRIAESKGVGKSRYRSFKYFREVKL